MPFVCIPFAFLFQLRCLTCTFTIQLHSLSLKIYLLLNLISIMFTLSSLLSLFGLKSSAFLFFKENNKHYHLYHNHHLLLFTHCRLPSVLYTIESHFTFIITFSGHLLISYSFQSSNIFVITCLPACPSSFSSSFTLSIGFAFHNKRRSTNKHTYTPF